MAEHYRRDKRFDTIQLITGRYSPFFIILIYSYSANDSNLIIVHAINFR
jgi:hypothetical protein